MISLPTCWPAWMPRAATLHVVAFTSSRPGRGQVPRLSLLRWTARHCKPVEQLAISKWLGENVMLRSPERRDDTFRLNDRFSVDQTE